ncbi:hypothetical protein CEUSTIGMA_g8879.t1 [Chlamydomonas eustigma]|uniref:DJ-1/PfpI domain-containing protein n=1 Tax=Chlamydomonas eustigma TaxID=1157962 RepID=A0A250XF88_9CHLO|nr:hypothetical protein CEUSTIGMA_g8879.t1 [Chlamydomonas eustigma]|eukprot:GAX81450.1 hypothetical protein CEUSTIGMA_g8879.t1 [Chlamydomonas eustigma]
MSVSEPPKIQILVLIFPGFEPLDADGLLCMFGCLAHVDVITIAADPVPVTSKTGNLTWLASHGFAEAKELQTSAKAEGKESWLLVPGGIGTRDLVSKQDFLSSLQQLAMGCDRLLSVCTGAALLAAAGLLEGKRATTNKLAWAWATSHGGAGVTWIKRARWVHDGHVTTAAGVSAGMDMALDVVRIVFGEGTSKFCARRAEYEAHQEPDWDPFGENSDLENS